MKKIIRLLILELCLVSASYGSNAHLEPENAGNRAERVGFAMQYLQDSLDWNQNLSADQIDTIRSVYRQISVLPMTEISAEKYKNLIDYITEDFHYSIYSEDPAKRQEIVDTLVIKCEDALS